MRMLLPALLGSLPLGRCSQGESKFVTTWELASTGYNNGSYPLCSSLLLGLGLHTDPEPTSCLQSLFLFPITQAIRTWVIEFLSRILDLSFRDFLFLAVRG
jgi:hypothetical protein